MRARRDIVGKGGIVLLGSCTVKVNGQPAVKKGDLVMPHFGGLEHKIPNPIISGACTVLVEGAPMVRQGDFSACFDPVITGACDVQVGTATFKVEIQQEIESGVVEVEGRSVYTNTPEGIQSIIRTESSVSASLPGYHEDAPGQVQSEQTTPEPQAVPANGCTNSKYFRLSDSKMPIQAQNGLTKQQIECNWIALCTNILDRLRDDGFTFSINSGFRTTEYNQTVGGSNNSDHSIGCAVDIRAGNVEANKKLFRHILNNYPYSQLIFEGNWIHIAYNGRGPKGEARVMWSYTGTNLQVAGAQGQNLPTELRA